MRAARLRCLHTRRDHPPTSRPTFCPFYICHPRFFPSSWSVKKLRLFPHAPAKTRAVPNAWPGHRAATSTSRCVFILRPDCSLSVGCAPPPPMLLAQLPSLLPNVLPKTAPQVTLPPPAPALHPWSCLAPSAQHPPPLGCVFKAIEWEGSGAVLFSSRTFRQNYTVNPRLPLVNVLPHSSYRAIYSPPPNHLVSMPLEVTGKGRNQHTSFYFGKHITIYSSVCLQGFFLKVKFTVKCADPTRKRR